ncbi:MAG: hypothetical protein WC980_05895 [Candidatus Brocadiia bacterium]
MKVRANLYLIIGILFVIIGILSSTSFEDVSFFFYVVSFLPAAVLLACYAFSRRMKAIWPHFIFASACVLAMLVWAFITMGAAMWDSCTREETRVDRYEKMISSSSGELLEHFPRKIPPDAKNVRFSYLPQFLQGGGHMQIRYTLPADRITELYGQFSKIKTKSFFGGNINIHMNMENGMPTTDFYTNDFGNLSPKERYQKMKFPDDYEIMIFDKIIKSSESVDGYWNHGESHGVVISKQRNEIIYWADFW